jgi:hypothetical protein
MATAHLSRPDPKAQAIISILELIEQILCPHPDEIVTTAGGAIVVECKRCGRSSSRRGDIFFRPWPRELITTTATDC